MDTENKFKFIEAKKLITSPMHLETFHKGPGYQIVMDFICALQKSVEGKTSQDCLISTENKCLTNFSKVLNQLQDLIKETPPLENPQRFGNKAFKLWYDKVEAIYDELISQIIVKEKDPNLDLELKSYFLDCFGSGKRIDYGTGHELNFICILLILYVTGYFKEEEFSAVVSHIFWPYIILVRNLQTTYKLEPAGAHGVWGLDEYHFMPFLFGASQLIGNKDDISPASIHNNFLLDTFEEKYMYLSCVKYLKKVVFIITIG
jgi:serine/threonine-protein phosphatase 2A activator